MVTKRGAKGAEGADGEKTTLQAAATTGTASKLARPPVADDKEQVFAVAHIFASFNDTFIHVTDTSGVSYYYYCFF